MTETHKGIVAMIGACVVWGLSPLYYKMLSHIPPIEILAHRTLWSLVIFATVLLVQGRIDLLRAALSSRKAVLVIGFAALMISLNWFVFIMSIQIGRAVEASMGYYIFPLVAVMLGVVAFGERLSRGQAAAVALAVIAVLVLSLGLGVPPWIALILAGSFGLYGLVKKRLSVGPVVSVTAEVLLLSPLALGVLGWMHRDGGGAFGAQLGDSLLLIASGALTAAPLILFSYATRRVAMATIGLVQYLNPTLQFMCAVIVFGEPFGKWHVIAFALIWSALALYSTVTLFQDRAARKAATNSASS